ncbi:coiled-coil domain-containing protein 77-like isoform X2 [Cimex lectularius]|nr:coiled-coil domain-containing protein 77-like isoform X2 [Cimex lectularius]
MARWVDHSAPTNRLLEFYQGKVREMRSKYTDLLRFVNEAKDLVVKNADQEVESIHAIRSTSKLQDSLSELQRYLYKERETVLRLTSEIDRLKVERADDKRKIAFLLDHCGLKEAQLYINPLDRLASPLQRRQKPKVRFNDVRALKNKLAEFKQSEYEILNMRIKALETELKEQTELLQDEICILENDLDLKSKEWLATRQLLEQKASCLNCRLQNVQLRKLDGISEFFQDLDKERTREIKLMEENDRLTRCVNICKELLGDQFPGDNNCKPQRRKDETSLLKEQLVQKDRLIRSFQGQIADFETRLNQVRKTLEAERETCQKVKERAASKEEQLAKKLEEERTRRILDGEGFRNDIKLLRSKLQSIERKFRHERIRRGIKDND